MLLILKYKIVESNKRKITYYEIDNFSSDNDGISFFLSKSLYVITKEDGKVIFNIISNNGFETEELKIEIKDLEAFLWDVDGSLEIAKSDIFKKIDKN